MSDMRDGLGGQQPIPSPVAESWKPVATDRGLVLGQSSSHYAVYDHQNLYGTWPLTQEGYGFAVRTYEAHRQSMGHGMAYTATGYEDPARLGLPTEAKLKSQTYASPMSYVGSTRRIASWATKTAKRSPTFSILAWIVAAFAMLSMWIFLMFWYIVVFGLFGVFTFPYRFIRRSQRKNLHVQQTTLATQQAMLQQMAAQQQALLRQQQYGQAPLPGATPLPPPPAPAIPAPPQPQTIQAPPPSA